MKNINSAKNVLKHYKQCTNAKTHKKNMERDTKTQKTQIMLKYLKYREGKKGKEKQRK